LFNFYLKIIHPDYWEYQKRINNGSMNPIQKRSSQWEYHRNAARKRSDSLSAINSPTNNQLKYDRYSIC